MAEQKTTAGAKAPVKKRTSVARSAGASETVTSKAPAKTEAPAKAKPARAKASESKTSEAQKGRSEPAATKARKVRSAAPKKAARKGAKADGPASTAAATSLFDLAMATKSTGPAAAVNADPVMESKAEAPAPRATEAPATALGEAGPEQLRQAYTRFRSTNATLRNAVSETTTAATSSVLEVNGKVIDAIRAQSDAAFDLWRSTLSAGSLSEAVRLQTSGARQAYETAASHWKDMAETTTRLFNAAVKPFQSALTDRLR